MYIDSHTRLYYLQSRYYDPEIGRWINADGQIPGVGGPTLGYNMFAYCFNNPSNMTDPAGNWPQWFKNAVKWVVAKVVKPGVDYVKEKTTGCKIGISKSQSLNVQIDHLTVGGSAGISVHMNGDVVIQTDVSVEMSSSGGFGVSSQTGVSVDLVPNYELQNDSLHVGVSAASPIPNAPISGDGSVVYRQYFSEDGTEMYPSFGINAGAAYPACTNLEFGVFAGMSTSREYFKFNIYDELESGFIKIMEW